jgi:hypothetical protein
MVPTPRPARPHPECLHWWRWTHTFVLLPAVLGLSGAKHWLRSAAAGGEAGAHVMVQGRFMRHDWHPTIVD